MASAKKKVTTKAGKTAKAAKASSSVIPAAAPKKGSKAWVVVLLLLVLLGGLVVQTVFMAKRKAAMTWDMIRIGSIVPKGLSDGQGMGAISLRGDQQDNFYFLEGLPGDQPRLQKFDALGTFVARYQPQSPAEIIVAPKGLHVAADGSCGVVQANGVIKVMSPSLKFRANLDAGCQATGVGQDAKGNWLVSCGQENKIVVLDAKGKRVHQFGMPGTNTGDISAPTRLASTSKGEIVVLEILPTGPRVKVFSPDYALLRQFSVGEITWSESTGMGVTQDGLIWFNDQVGDKAVAAYDMHKGKYKGNTKGTKDNQLFFSPGAGGANAWGTSVYVGTVGGTIKSRMPSAEGN